MVSVLKSDEDLDGLDQSGITNTSKKSKGATFVDDDENKKKYLMKQIDFLVPKETALSKALERDIRLEQDGHSISEPTIA